MKAASALFPLLVAAVVPLTAAQPLARVESVTTETADFAPGGTVRIEGSTGELSVEGWDRPSVEMTVTRYRWSGNAERAKRELDRIKVSQPVVSGTQLTITARHHRSPGTHVDYRIRVPRDSNLVIRHGIGDVVVYDVGGNIDADAAAGEMMLQIPSSARYDIDARNKAGGTIDSDFAGKDRTAWVIMGGRFESGAPGASRHLRLRVGFGGIVIQAMQGRRLRLPSV